MPNRGEKQIIIQALIMQANTVQVVRDSEYDVVARKLATIIWTMVTH
jgi:hypothetical protein